MDLLRQPKAVWATAGASVAAFMGIGLVDPILPSVAQGLHATAGQVPLLFTSYSDHRGRHAAHRLRLQPHRRPQDPAAPPGACCSPPSR